MATLDFIIRKVDFLVRRHGTRDPFVICERLQINVRCKPLCSQLKAFSFYQSRMKTIFLDTGTDEQLHPMLCAHELGHAILHNQILINMRCIPEKTLFNSTDRTENEANLFAAELLIPDRELLDLLTSFGQTLYEAAGSLCQPVELLDFKLRMLQHKGYDIQAPFLAQADFLKRV